MSIRADIEQRFERFGLFISRRRLIVIPLMLAAAFSLSSQAPSINFDTSVDAFLRKGSPAKLLYSDFREQFGRDEVLIAVVRSPDILNPQFLRKLEAFHLAIEDETPNIKEVRSLINARVTRGQEDQLDVRDLFEEWPESDASWEELRRYVSSNPLYEDLLVSSSGDLTTVIIELNTYSSEEYEDSDILEGFADQGDSAPSFLSGHEARISCEAVEDIANRFRSSDFEIDLVGPPLLQSQITAAMPRDMARFVILMFIIIAALLYFFFRRISGVILPLLVVAPAVSGTIGIMALSGVQMSAPTQVLPSMLLAIGVGAAVHTLTIFYQRLDAGVPQDKAMAQALGHSGLAITMTSLTTAGGLISFMGAEAEPVRTVGLFAPIGIGLALIYCLVLLPSLATLFPIRPRVILDSKDKNDRVETFLVASGEFSMRHSRVILAVIGVLVAISLVGVSRIRFGHDIMGWLPDENPIHQATAIFDEELAGSVGLEILIDTGRENGVHDVEILDALDSLSSDLNSVEAIDGLPLGKATSITDVLKEIHQALNSNEPEFYEIPDDRQLIAQEFLLFENSGSDDLERIVDSQFSQTRFTIRVPYTDPTLYSSFIDEIMLRFRQALGPDVDIQATGFMAVMSQTISSLLSSLIQSYVLALLIITPLMILLIGSLRIGLASMVPNLAPIIITLGLMGWFGIAIDAFTLMIGGIAIGLCVDDTIHYMHNFRRYFLEYGDIRRANKETLRTTGRALLITSVVLSSGFIIFIFSEMNNLFYFGLLTSFTIASAFLIDILVSPALMAIAHGGLDSDQKN